MKQIRITVTATIPEGGDKHLGHKAVVATEESVAAVVAVLDGLGLKAEANRDLVTRRDEAPPKPAVNLAAAE